MKASEVPDAAWDAQPTPIPTKVVYDWDALLAIMGKQGFVIINSDNVRGKYDCVEVKMFNSYLRSTKKLRLQTKRLTKSRWFCTL